jgi:hypothetical protein
MNSPNETQPNQQNKSRKCAGRKTMLIDEEYPAVGSSTTPQTENMEAAEQQLILQKREERENC